MPYGWKHGLWRDEDFGPPTKWSHRSGCRYRKKDRRLLHKKARNSLKRDLSKLVEDKC